MIHMAQYLSRGLFAIAEILVYFMNGNLPMPNYLSRSYRQKCSLSYRPITLVGSSRMRATLTGRVFASLYCTFTPVSPTAHIAQWQDAPALCHRSWVRIPWWYDFLSFFYLLRFLSHFSLYYCHLFTLTSISVIIYICRPYESSISIRHIGRYDFLIFC